MALTQIRVKFTAIHSSYRPGDIGYFTPIVAQALVDIGVGTALDSVPTGTLRVVQRLPGNPNGHVVRVARDAELVASEADRLLVAAQAALMA